MSFTKVIIKCESVSEASQESRSLIGVKKDVIFFFQALRKYTYRQIRETCVFICVEGKKNNRKDTH
jgi:hypothetical protein